MTKVKITVAGIINLMKIKAINTSTANNGSISYLHDVQIELLVRIANSVIRACVTVNPVKSAFCVGKAPHFLGYLDVQTWV